MFTQEFKKKGLLDLGGKKKANVDHILVRDYVRKIDIGAFQSEYGVKQRVAFNVILEVNTDNQPMHDNVDLVLSYDNIIEIIEDEIGQKRVALLETLAEKIAISCLCLDSVVTATVRLEKLDRGLGKLGVQISRTKVQPDASKTNLNLVNKNNLIIKTRIPNAGLLFISNRMLQQKNISYLQEFISNSTMTWVICLSEIYKEFSEMNPETDIEILIMAVAQNAYMLNKKFTNLKLARSKTEVAFLLKEGVNCIWCPTDRYKLSKTDGLLNKEFALSMACHLTKGLLMRKIYFFRQDELSDVLTEGIHKLGVTVEYF
ncbi:dihydroneopterin aldolase [Paracoccaceae bacterium]|nr:dihydroneopterin aldolase [Paracoccaceae bacterium]